MPVTNSKELGQMQSKTEKVLQVTFWTVSQLED